MAVRHPSLAVVVRSTFYHVECLDDTGELLHALPHFVARRRSTSEPPARGRTSWSRSGIAAAARPVRYVLDDEWRVVEPSPSAQMAPRAQGSPGATLAAPIAAPWELSRPVSISKKGERPATPDPRRIGHGSVDTSTDEGSGEVSVSHSACSDDVDGRSTVMMRNVPRNLSRERLLRILHEAGFLGEIDFLYLPVDFKSGLVVGYAFVNLTSPSAATRFKQRLNRFRQWSVRTSLVCNTSWARDEQQGLAANVERYRNSSVMHPSVAAEHRPLLLVGGAPASFPSPTKRISAPLRR